MKTYSLKISVLLFLFTILPTFAQIQFSPYINIPTGSWPEVVAIDDVNNDGLKDVVLGMKSYGNSTNNFTIMVFVQNINGTLNPPVAYPYNSTSFGITSIDINDLNNDGLNDVIIGYDTKIGVFFQNNSGTLNPVFDTNTNLGIYSLKLKDLNNDGLLDIITGTYGNSFKIYYQTSSGYNEVTISKPSFNFNEVEIADINNDQKPDLVFMSRYHDTVYIYYQNSNGNYDNYVAHDTDLSIGGISVGDVNHDGLNDIGITGYANSPNSKIAVLFQNPNTNLLNAATITNAYDCPQPTEIADLNNDGSNELIAVHGGWMRLSVFEQNTAFFNPYTLFNIPYASHYSTQGVAVGDINNDGRKDIAISDSNYGLVILYNISTLSTDENTLGNDRYIIYPNPVTDSFTIKKEDSQPTTFELSDVNGKVLITGDNSNFDAIDISHFPQGFYFLTLKTEHSKQTHKIIKR